MTLHTALECQLAESASFRGSLERMVSLIAVFKEQVAAQRREVDAFTRLTRSVMTLAWLAAQKVGVTSEEFVEAEAAFDANMLLKEFEGWASLLDPRPED